MGREAHARKTESGVQAPAKLTDAQLEQIHDDTRRLDVRDRVAYWDKRQARPENGAYPDGVLLCPNEPSHGALIINGSGTMLLCGVRKQGAVCTGTLPVSL